MTVKKGGDKMIERELKPNGDRGSKLITFPKTIIELAGFENVNKVNIDVKKGKIVIEKLKEEREIKNED